MTPSSVRGKCNSSLSIEIRLDGYETISETLELSQPSAKMERLLVPLPMGTAELFLNQSAQIYVENRYLGEVEANERIQVPLRTKKRYQLRFINSRAGIDTYREIVIQSSNTERFFINLKQDKSIPRQPASER